MSDLDKFLKRHDEIFIQYIVEIWERYNNVRYDNPVTLEERWDNFIRSTDHLAAAA